jgi:hypothetical protein
MRGPIGLMTAASLVTGQLGSTAALAQLPSRLPPQEQPAAKPAPAKPAATRPAPKPKPIVSRPAPEPAKPGGGFGGSGGSGGSGGGNKPGGGFGGSGGSSGGNKPGGGFGGSGGSGGTGGGFGGSGGSWQKPAPPPPPVRPPTGGWGGSGGSWNNNNWNNNNWNDWHGRVIKCESWNYRYARCNLDTNGGVRLVRVIAGDCRQGRSWGWDTRRNFVWVNRGCRAEFQARYGNWQGSNDNGVSTGAVIAGVAVAAGLVALLASKGKKADSNTGSATPAAINVAAGAVPAAAEQSFRLCLDEAARQIGATGGTSIRLLGAVETTPGNGGWRFRMPLESSWPGDTHATPAYCRATNSKLVELSFHEG